MTILLLDTSTPTCDMFLVTNKGRTQQMSWQADRQLAKDLLVKLNGFLGQYSITFHELDGIGVYKGPGSYTGLRIGITVANTLADSLNIPICGKTGDNWQSEAIDALESSVNEKIVLPEYGSEPNITQARK